VFLAPAMAPALLLAFAGSGSWPITIAKKVGRHGRIISVYRLRTRFNRSGRSTLFGPFLEWSGLAAAPMLLNVVQGRMSLVGPRPVTRAELGDYGRDRRFYLLVKPGLVGLSQKSASRPLRLTERTAYDRLYVQTWSFWLDIQILLAALYQPPARLRP
jgi:lipopolysaccharide/colanic/teichoic acid biosynthesis glycosyltransferase